MEGEGGYAHREVVRVVGEVGAGVEEAGEVGAGAGAEEAAEVAFSAERSFPDSIFLLKENPVLLARTRTRRAGVPKRNPTTFLAA